MKRNKRHFTLLELIIAMAVFGLFAVGLMQFFNTTQNVMISSSGMAEMMDRARTALDMMASDIACAVQPATGTSSATNVWQSNEDSFSVLTKRPGKVQDDGGSYSKTNIAAVAYELSNNRLSYGVKTDATSIGSVPADTAIVDGVKDFRGSTKKSGDAVLPFMVVLELELYPWDDWVKADYSASGIDDKRAWTFTRTVTIDRGQNTSSSTSN